MKRDGLRAVLMCSGFVNRYMRNASIRQRRSQSHFTLIMVDFCLLLKILSRRSANNWWIVGLGLWSRTRPGAVQTISMICMLGGWFHRTVPFQIGSRAAPPSLSGPFDALPTCCRWSVCPRLLMASHRIHCHAHFFQRVRGKMFDLRCRSV